MTGKTEIGIRELTQELGDGFKLRGWEDPESLAFEIAQAARKTESLDPAASAGLASKVFLERNGIERGELEDLVADLFARHTLMPAERDYPTTVERHTNTFVISGDNNYVANVNVGERQTILAADTAREKVLEAVRALVQGGFEVPIEQDELIQLDRFVSSRSDLDLTEIESATREGIEEAKPEPGGLAKMRETVMTSAASGLLVQAIIAVTGALL
jgi:hypothetical protein